MSIKTKNFLSRYWKLVVPIFLTFSLVLSVTTVKQITRLVSKAALELKSSISLSNWTWRRTIEKKYFLLVFNPVLENEGGKKLIDYYNWNNPYDLTSTFAADIFTSSNRWVKYIEAGRLEVDGYPTKIDGFIYTDQSYLKCWRDRQRTFCHSPDISDYRKILKDYQICEKLNDGKIDELWMFGAPYFGFAETNQAGKGAFWTNGPIITDTSCQRILNIFGFNYERGVAEMLENMGHRVEGTMVNAVYHSWDPVSGRTLWDKYTRYDKITPGQAHCGTVHEAPNSQSGYDWRNQSYVKSFCDDWLDFPSFNGKNRSIDCSDWKCDAREHKIWWLSHLPHVPGYSSDGKLANWWKYIVNYENTSSAPTPTPTSTPVITIAPQPTPETGAKCSSDSDDRCVGKSIREDCGANRICKKDENLKGKDGKYICECRGGQ